jgi:hypothetical protein
VTNPFLLSGTTEFVSKAEGGRRTVARGGGISRSGASKYSAAGRFL